MQNVLSGVCKMDVFSLGRNQGRETSQCDQGTQAFFLAAHHRQCVASSLSRGAAWPLAMISVAKPAEGRKA